MSRVHDRDERDLTISTSTIVHKMADRAGAAITEIEGSHAVMVSQPQAVTDVIMEALRGVAR